nr:uncharacterized protein LOC127349374 [Lolium perenne]
MPLRAGQGPYPCSGQKATPASMPLSRKIPSGGGTRAASKSSSSPRNGAAGLPRSQSIGGMWNTGCRGAGGGWVLPLGQPECLGRSLPGQRVQCEAPGGGCRDDDRHDDGGSSGRGDDDHQVQSGGGGHGRGCGGGNQSRGGGDGNRSRGSGGILSAGVVRTWGGDESPSGGNEPRRMQSRAGFLPFLPYVLSFLLLR